MTQNRLSPRTFLMGSAALLGLAAQPALAQVQEDPPVPQETAGAADTNQAEIVVTAQKRTQVLIDVPQSISVVSGATLEDQNASSFADYLKLVPGLQLNQSTPGQGRLIVRGVNSGGVASTVGIYMDETPFGSSSGLVNAAVLAGDFDTFDLDRIEVLRGPQGTIYGASSLSGVLKFVTRQPSTAALTARGRVGVETTAGGEMGYNANLVVNVPLGDTLAFRATGSYRKHGGFIDSIGTSGTDLLGAVLTSDRAKNINDSKSFGGRASLLYKPSDKVTLRFTALAQNIEADAPSVVASDPETLERLYGELSQAQFVPEFSDVKYRVYNATGAIDLGFADLTSSTSYSTQKQDFRADLTFPLSSLIDAAFGYPANEFFQAQSTNSKKFTQEVRLSSESKRLDWLAGIYYTSEDGLIDQDFIAVRPGTLNPIDDPGVPLLGLARVASEYKEIAGFADVTIHFSERFDLGLGGRYSSNKQEADQVSDGALAGGFNRFPTRKSTEDVFTYSVAPRFELNDNTSIYARVAKGFRPGGPNVLPPGAPAELGTYDSDSLISYEAGVKAQTPDGRFTVDAAVFHIDWTDIQLIATVSDFNINTNGSKAKVDGAEITATARPLRGLSLSLNAAYTDARLTEDLPPIQGAISGFDGDQLPFTPKFSAGLNGDYRWSLSNTLEASLGASLRHLSSQTASYDADFVAANGRQRRIDSYQVIDLRAGLDFGKYAIDAYVRNLGNSAGRTSTEGTTVFGPFPLNPNGAMNTGVIRPRTIGISLTAGL
ncbi:TonB-dependent receptor [Sphingomonas sp.]|uniref:TonB-dependent receptor n=1 Tax=Sphingomonas sp. TaxID=28214 RepID=UPI00286E6CF1|nr:TonB-dependent receptor [Sphingomonas sp.]